jgi:hypothetical protein
MGLACVGAVLVVGGALKVLLPRLPMEPPPPGFAIDIDADNVNPAMRAAANIDVFWRIIRLS